MVTLEQARKNVGLRQKEVAEMLGVNHVTVSNWETGKTLPTRERLAEICKLYRVSLYDLDLWKGKEIKEKPETVEPVGSDPDAWADGPKD